VTESATVSMLSKQVKFPMSISAAVVRLTNYQLVCVCVCVCSSLYLCMCNNAIQGTYSVVSSALTVARGINIDHCLVNTPSKLGHSQ